MSLASGTSVGRYRIVAPLGAGGMGEVYRALDTRLKREVALKVLPAGLLGDPDRRRRFLLEAEATAALSHPRVAAIYDADDADGVCYLAMELVEGAPLTERLRSGALPLADALTLAGEVAEGLAYAHAKGILHRDIKPANVLLDAGGHAKLIDFGLAKLRDQGSAETTTGMATADGRVLGTAAYMAPEQARGLPVDVRTDIFSFGLLLYELLTGCRPFDRGSWPDSVAAVLRDPVPPLSATGLTGELAGLAQRLLDRCLAKDATGRPASMTEVLRDLAAIRAMTLAGSGDDARPIHRLGAEQASIVVLPFENLSPDPDNAFFADGLTEELISDLSKVKALRVISRTSAMRYRNTTKSVPEIAAELWVGHVLEGSVRRAGNNLRITAQLIQAATDAHLWAEKYTGTLDDVFDLQEQLSRRIVDALRVALRPDEDRRLAARPLGDVRALDCYLRAWQQIRTFAEPNLDRALQLIDHARSAVGERALLYATRASVLWQYYNAGIRPEEATLQAADALAGEALVLDGECAQAWSARGAIAYSRGRLQDAARALRTGAELGQDADAFALLSWVYALNDRVDAARDAADRALACDPFNPYSLWTRATFEFVCGNLDAAIDRYRLGAAVAPDNPMLLGFQALAFAYAGEADQAFVVLERVALLVPAWSSWMGMVAGALRKDLDAVRRGASDMTAYATRDKEVSWTFAGCLAAVGERDEALAWLGNAIELGFVNHRFLGTRDPFLAPLRGDPRFEALMDRAREKERAFDAS